MNGGKMRTGPRLSMIAAFLFAVMLCAGCASMAERGLLPDVKARRQPDVNLSREVILLEEAKIAQGSNFKSVIGTDGRAHLFVADEGKRIHHVEVSGNEVLLREILGTMEGDAPNQAIDAVEHPAGKLRVLAGNKQFIRSAPDNKWHEIKGNLCSRFITAGDDLLCAFIANGKEIGAPTRRDWTVGWFILLPVVFWSDVIADKLVLAQESRDGWTIRAVFDPETKLSARSDFMAGTDQNGSLHFLYRASGESSAFIIAFAPGGGGAWGQDTSAMEIRYARVQYDRLFSGNKNGGSQGEEAGDAPIPWESIQGLPLAPLPYVEDKYQRPTSLSLIGPLERHFAVNGTLGELGGLVWIYNLGLDDGMHRLRTSDMPWIHVKIKEGKWAPHFDVVTASDLPESGWRWIHDRGALIKNDSLGNNHVLLVKSKPGFWRSTNEMCYFFHTGGDWSAPLILGSNLGIDSHRSLAVDGTGKVFAVWQNRNNRVVGRWILPQK